MREFRTGKSCTMNAITTRAAADADNRDRWVEAALKDLSTGMIPTLPQ